MHHLIQKTRQDYNKIAQHFSGTRYDVWPELEQFKPLIKDGQRILDWGCGNGRLLLLIGERAAHYVGVDQSIELLKIARHKHLLAIKAGRARFYSTARREKKFPSNYFDLVFMVASFHHLPDSASRLALLKKVQQELKPEGKLVITVWNLSSTWARQVLQKKGWHQIGKQDFLIPWKDNRTGKVIVERYYHHCTPTEMRGLLKEAGFKVIRLGYGPGVKTSERKGRNLIVVATKK